MSGDVSDGLELLAGTHAVVDGQRPGSRVESDGAHAQTGEVDPPAGRHQQPLGRERHMQRSPNAPRGMLARPSPDHPGSGKSSPVTVCSAAPGQQLHPDLLGDAGWRQTPLWTYAVFAVVIYSRAAAERLAVSTGEIAQRNRRQTASRASDCPGSVRGTWRVTQEGHDRSRDSPNEGTRLPVSPPAA